MADSNKLLYTYNRTTVDGSVIPNDVLTTYTDSIIFDKDRQSLYTHNTEFGYATHLNYFGQTTYTDTTYFIQNIGTKADGTLTYTISGMSSNDVTPSERSKDFLTYVGWQGTQLSYSYSSFHTIEDTNAHNQIISYVYIDKTGTLHREIKSITYTSNKSPLTSNDGVEERITGTTYAAILNGIGESANGDMTYNYTYVGSTFTSASNATTTKDTNTFVTNTYLSDDGTGAYTLNVTYSTFANSQDTNAHNQIVTYTYIDNDGKLHREVKELSDTANTSTATNTTTNERITGTTSALILNGLDEDKDGSITYNYTYVGSTFTSASNATTAKGTNTFVTNTYLSDDGTGAYTLNVTYSTFGNIQDTNAHNQIVTYTYIDNDGLFHREVKELSESSNTSTLTSTTTTNERITGTTSAVILNGLDEDKDGSITYNYTYVGSTFTALNTATTPRANYQYITDSHLTDNGTGTYTITNSYATIAGSAAVGSVDVDEVNVLSTYMTYDTASNVTYNTTTYSLATKKYIDTLVSPVAQTVPESHPILTTPSTTPTDSGRPKYNATYITAGTSTTAYTSIGADFTGKEVLYSPNIQTQTLNGRGPLVMNNGSTYTLVVSNDIGIVTPSTPDTQITFIIA